MTSVYLLLGVFGVQLSMFSVESVSPKSVGDNPRRRRLLLKLATLFCLLPSDASFDVELFRRGRWTGLMTSSNSSVSSLQSKTNITL